jgi:hypothetical protein
MADWELFCPDQASMDAALAFMNLRYKPSGKMGASYFGVDPYGTKYLQSTTTPTVVDGFGKSGRNMVAQTGVYANIRWVGPTAVPPLPNGSTCTIKLQTKPADYRDWA